VVWKLTGENCSYRRKACTTCLPQIPHGGLCQWLR
jgi:hypothetical protein